MMSCAWFLREESDSRISPNTFLVTERTIVLTIQLSMLIYPFNMLAIFCHSGIKSWHRSSELSQLAAEHFWQQNPWFLTDQISHRQLASMSWHLSSGHYAPSSSPAPQASSPDWQHLLLLSASLGSVSGCTSPHIPTACYIGHHISHHVAHHVGVTITWKSRQTLHSKSFIKNIRRLQASAPWHLKVSHTFSL